MKLRHSFCIVHFTMKWINAVLNRDTKKCVCVCLCVQALLGTIALDYIYHTLASYKCEYLKNDSENSQCNNYIPVFIQFITNYIFSSYQFWGKWQCRSFLASWWMMSLKLIFWVFLKWKSIGWEEHKID